MRSRTVLRLKIALALLAWLAQAFMPLAHAVTMAQPREAGLLWCGDPAMAAEAMAVLPPELRANLDEGVGAQQLATCVLLCAAASPPPLLADLPAVAVVRAAGLEPSRPHPPAPASRPQSRIPPAHAPPLLA